MKHLVTLTTVILWLAMPAHAAQIITPAQTTVTASSGSTLAFTPVYSVSAPENGAETGLGLRVHFNANALQFKGVSGQFAYATQPVGEITADTDDLDADPSTDQYFILAWADVTAQWPGVNELPLNLVNASFTLQAGFTGTTHIRTTASGTVDGASFHSTPMAITVAPNNALAAVNVRGFLQGAYVAADGWMQDSLRTAGLIPLAQPYAYLGHPGNETTSAALLTTSGADAPVDWVLVELRDKANPKTRLTSKAALLQRDGDVVDATTASNTLVFADAPAGSYYVTLRHRNHLGMMNAAPLALSATPAMLDFSLATTAVYGKDIRTPQGSTLLLPAGDANTDNKLIAEGVGNDKNTVLSTILSAPANAAAHTNFVFNGYSLTDLNLDGKTVYAGAGNDLNALLGNILLAPGNSTSSTNYILPGSLPQ